MLASSFLIFIPTQRFSLDALLPAKRENDSLQDELLPGLGITVQQIFQQAGLV